MSLEKPGTAPRADATLRQELQQAYQTLSEITSRLLLVNEAADAALSTHDRVDLCERLLDVAARGSGLRRGAVFLVEGESFSLGATRGLQDAEVEAAGSSEADVAVCARALAADTIEALDPDAIDPEARAWILEEAQMRARARAEQAAAEAEGEEEEDAEQEGGADTTEPEKNLDDDVVDAERAGEASKADEGDPLFTVYIPVTLEDEPVLVLALGERAGGRPYDTEGLVFLQHALRQFAVALSRGSLMEKNEERLRELDALLRISREITSSLDLDAVLRGVVNTVGALLEVDRAEIALMKGGRLSLRAVSAMTQPHPDQAEIFHLSPVLSYLDLHPTRLQIAADDYESGEPQAGELFVEYFSSQEMRSFMALPLRDDQGLLGFLCLESRRDAWELEPAEGDALDIVAAQTTVAIRNAMLYSHIPLRGVAAPLTAVKTRYAALAPSRRRNLALGAVVVLAAVALPIAPLRSGGSAEVRPAALLGVRVPTDGVVARVLVHGGAEVRAGQPIAVMEDLDLAGRLAGLEGDVELARRDATAARQSGDLTAWRAAQIRLQTAERSLEFERQRAQQTLLAAPFAGQIQELDLDQRAGEHLLAGQAFCTVAALDSMSADFEVPEERIHQVQVGQPVALKVAAFPAQAFHGRVTEIGWSGHALAKTGSRYTVRAAFANPGHRLRPGMTGIARVRLGRGSLAVEFFDPIVRALALRWW